MWLWGPLVETAAVLLAVVAGVVWVLALLSEDP